MSAVSIPSRQKSWQDPRQRVSVLAELAIHKKTVVEKLASLRDDHDLTQEKAAQAVGVTVRQWQRWESGASVPYPRNLDAIAARFGFDVADFFTDNEPIPARADEPAGRSQADQLDRLQELLELNNELLTALAVERGIIELSGASDARRAVEAWLTRRQAS